MSMFDGPCPHGRPSEFDCDRCSYDPILVTENMVARRLLDDERRANLYLSGRVEQLTAALTELVALYDGTHSMYTTLPRSIACGPITKVFEDAHDRARAALAPIEEKKD